MIVLVPESVAEAFLGDGGRPVVITLLVVIRVDFQVTVELTVVLVIALFQALIFAHSRYLF